MFFIPIVELILGSLLDKRKFRPVRQWFKERGRKPFEFQHQVWEAMLEENSGLLNAPTGSGKTYAIWIGLILKFYFEEARYSRDRGLKIIWVTPLRALAKDLHMALEEAVIQMNIPWRIGIRTGDTEQSERQKQVKNMPDCLITTPESIHILFSHKHHKKYFNNVGAIIVDEWHELMSTKRGVQMELALAHIKSLSKYRVLIWGVSATIANQEESLNVLIGSQADTKRKLIRASVEKVIEIRSVIPEEIEKYPWAGHIGIKLVPKILDIIDKSRTTLLFTNVRSQAEIWYRAILNKAPHLAGIMALHHGSIEQHIRMWVEDALKEGKLKLVVCTSSLDLGVDFSPVETVIQVGGPKGVSRFMQRAGRSGHQPGGLSSIYFVPTHALELIEGAALRTAQNKSIHESRLPLTNSLDVLVQYLVTLAVGGGFQKEELYEEIKSTHAYQSITPHEWDWVLNFITTGGDSLTYYEEFARVRRENDVFGVDKRRVSYQHRLSIGTIVSDPVLSVRFITGGYLGTIEESFISSLNEGNHFWFGGRCLEYIRIKDMTVYVRKSKKKGGVVPQWMGGRLPLSSKLSELILNKLEEVKAGNYDDEEIKAIKPILQLQQKYSVLPSRSILLIEKITTKEGQHIFIYPFEGRFVHEVLSAVIAYRISRIKPFTFSIAMNDYGFELLSDQEIPIEEALEEDLFSVENIMEDIEGSINKSELAKRKFRDIATISGLVFQGFPGRKVPNKHLQANSSIIYKVFEQYDPNNLLLKQAKEEVVTLQLDYQRLIEGLKRINNQKIVLTYPEKFTPFAFPIMADRLREKLSTEKLSDRLMRMQQQLEKDVG